MLQNRKHIRLRNYDYSCQNAYFITICTGERKNFFCGNVPVHIPVWQPETMTSAVGKTAENLLIDIPAHFPHVIVDEYTIMPNHIHCILMLDYTNTERHAGNISAISQELYQAKFNKFSNPVKGSVSVIIGQFKAAVKKWCNNNSHEYFDWQSRFYDHVIRTAESHEKIRNYIINNAKNWADDKFYFRPPVPGK